jgi:sulfate permease, SulP family
MIQSLRRDLQPRSLFPSLTIGAVTGIQNIVFTLAYAVMIFSGDLTSSITIGITIFIVGGILQALVISWKSSLPGMLSDVQDSPAAILAVIISAMLLAMPDASPDTKLYTSLAAIILAALIMGAMCLVLGFYRLGNLFNYVPYPVVSGFLAGTGLLLMLGAGQVMTGENITLLNLGPLFEMDALIHWLPGVVFAVVLFWLVMRIGHYLVLPAALLGAFVIFFGVLWVSGTTVTTAMANDWFIEGIPQGETLFRWWDPAGFRQVDWKLLLNQSGSLLACAVVSLLSLLMNLSALELSIGKEIELDSELRNNGWANLAGAVVGSLIGYPMLGASSLAYRLGARSRLNGIFNALILGLVLVVGGSFMAYFPNFILGGFLFFIGIDFLYTSLYRTWAVLPRLDYAIVVVIMLLINIAGFLQGVGAGLALAVVLFILQYSRTGAVRHTLSGVSYRSRVDRSRLYTGLLRKKGDWLHILELQGFIFFGTANQLVDKIRTRLETTNPPRYLILDFRLVTGADSSAGFSFSKIKRLAAGKGVGLVLTNLNPQTMKLLEKSLPASEASYFPDLDHGIEWCENQMIATFESVGLAARPGSLFKQLSRALPRSEDVETLKRYMQVCNYQPGDRIIKQGSEQTGLYMIEKGLVTIYLECEDGSLLRLRSLESGAFFGEMGVYSGEPASATVVAEQPTQLYQLSSMDIKRLEQEAPSIATAFHRLIIAYMSERVAKMTNTIEALVK